MPNFISDGHESKTSMANVPMVLGTEVIYGIDISWHNGLIDWEKVKEHKMLNESIAFVIMKATEGGDLIDSQFMYNWENSKQQGFTRGAYHFFTPFTDPLLQVKNYLNTVHHETNDFVPVLDFENDGRNRYEKSQLTENALIWLTEVEHHIGKKPVIYTNHRIYNNYIKGKIEGYDIWLADYSVFNPMIYDIPEMIMWQHSDQGRVLGINKDVDLNLFFGTQHKFNKYLIN